MRDQERKAQHVRFRAVTKTGIRGHWQFYKSLVPLRVCVQTGGRMASSKAVICVAEEQKVAASRS